MNSHNFSYDDLKTAIQKAKCKRQESFFFCDNELLVKFAEYFLEFLKMQLKNKGVTESEKVFVFQEHTEIPMFSRGELN